MQRAHKIRLNPTPEQQQYFRKATGTARFVYNWGLTEVKRALSEQRKPESVFDLKARFNAIKRVTFPWVYEVTKCAAEGAFRNLGAALKNFLASKRGQRKDQRMGFPKFKSKKRGQGSFYLANDKFSVDGHWLSIPKLGRVNMTEPLRLAAIDRFYPSSKIHNGCGGYKADLDLSDRRWMCEACGAQVDRDLNAARNIRDEALRVSASSVVATSGCQLPVDAM